MEDPIKKFTVWFGEAQASGLKEPTAMTLATATQDGVPSARIVLLKAYDARGFVFYTNFDSRKGQEMAENPYAALVFYWSQLDKQIRIEGSLGPVTDAEANAYFASRERHRQAGAWASLQSQPLYSRETLLARANDIEKKYAGKDIPRPPNWGGTRLIPARIEFWHQRDARLHDREVYTMTSQGWSHTLLYP